MLEGFKQESLNIALIAKNNRTHRTHETPAIVEIELLAVSHCPRLAAATVAAGISKLNLATETSFSCCFQTLQQYIALELLRPEEVGLSIWLEIEPR